MAMLFRTHYKLARASIRQNRGRSFLTCLGVAVGIASIILILSLTGSIQQLIKTEVNSIGPDLIVVRPATTKDTVTSIVEELTSSNSFERSNLTLGDVKTIRGIEGVAAVAPIAISSNTVSDDENVIASATVLGTSPDFIDIEPLTLQNGTFLTDKNKENSIVVGHHLALELFNTSNPVGRTLGFQGQRYIVVGVLEKIEKSVNFNNVDLDNAMIMDVDVLAPLLGSIQIQQINVKAVSTSVLSELSGEIRTALLETKAGDTNFTVAYGDAITHPASHLLDIVSWALALVAGISLVVGGIGVMNIMLVSVAERSHEIGIRKAVGASSYNILTQFMLESLILSVIGGVFGIILGYIFAFFVSLITPFMPYASWEIIIVSLLTTACVGVIFGIYPAIKAASKNPIDSLKHYQ